MSTQPKSFLTPEQYLEIERAAEFKSEYWNGEMFAMAGAKRAHNLIVMNTSGEFREQLRSRQCEHHTNDMRVRTSPTFYTYPDVVAVCGDAQFLDEGGDTLLNPSLIVEVLSPSTERYDRGLKFEQYRQIESLREYLLLASDRMHAELFSKDSSGKWQLSEWRAPEDIIPIESMDCRLKLANLYEKVVFPAQAEGR